MFPSLNRIRICHDSRPARGERQSHHRNCGRRVRYPRIYRRFDARTGKEAWRFYTIPGPGEPGHETWPANSDSWQHGGASVWVTGSYDPDLNLTYWGIGNPGPDRNGDERAGDNLYSCSVVALDVDTGKLKWYYQFSPHDEFDFDSTQVPVLADMQWQGARAKRCYSPIETDSSTSSTARPVIPAR
jgi:glucose dehydrogenase